MPAPIEVRKVPLHNVSDASELAKLIDDGVMDADRVVAVIGKTEGNGGVNDYTRIIADLPMSSGSSCSLIANPTVRRGSSLGSTASSGRVAKTVA